MAWVDRKWDQQNTVILSYYATLCLCTFCYTLKEAFARFSCDLHAVHPFHGFWVHVNTAPFVVTPGYSMQTSLRPAQDSPSQFTRCRLTMTSLHHLLCTMLPQEIQSPCACNPQEKAKTHQRLRKRNALGSREIRLSEAWDSMRHSVLLGSKGRQVALELCQPGARCIKTQDMPRNFQVRVGQYVASLCDICMKLDWNHMMDGVSFPQTCMRIYLMSLTRSVPAPQKQQPAYCQRMFQKDSATNTLRKKLIEPSRSECSAVCWNQALSNT